MEGGGIFRFEVEDEGEVSVDGLGSVWLVAYGPTWPVVCNFGRFGCLHPVLGLARRVQKAEPSLAAGKRK
jgi:hypothetical protein